MLHGVGWSRAALVVGSPLLAIVSLGVSGLVASLPEDVTTVAGGHGTRSAAKQRKIPTDAAR